MNKKPLSKKCIICGKTYYRDIRYTYKQFSESVCCSLECKYKLQKKLIAGKKHYYWKGGLPKCIDCGKQLKNYQNKRCRSCWYKFNTGENNGNYKQFNLGYKYLHQVIRKQFGNPPKCEHCGKIGKIVNGRWNIEWANKTGKYLRDDRNDWIALCKSCHRIYDIKNNLIHHTQERR